MDSSIIDLCLEIYDWAHFRRTKGAIKLHLLLDHDGYLPSFAIITEGRVSDVKVARQFKFDPDTIVVDDRGYNDYELFGRWTSGGVYFVTRMKDNALFEVIGQRKVPLFEMVSWCRAIVAHDCRAQVKGALYTIPYQHRSKTVWARVRSKVVEFYLDWELIKEHRRGAKGEKVTDWNDYPPEKSAFYQRTPDWYRSQASLVGRSTRETIDALLEKHAFYYLRQCRGILNMSGKYGKDRVEAACARANAFGDPAYHTVKTILERGLDRQPFLFEPPKTSGAFLRGPDELFWNIKS